MAALKLDMTIPLADAGHVHFAIDITDLDALAPEQRATLAATGAEFYAFAAATLAPQVDVDMDALRDALKPEPAPDPPPATVYDPNMDVLNGATGSRRQ